MRYQFILGEHPPTEWFINTIQQEIRDNKGKIVGYKLKNRSEAYIGDTILHYNNISTVVPYRSAKLIYPEWKPNLRYSKGTILVYNDLVYSTQEVVEAKDKQLPEESEKYKKIERRKVNENRLG